MGLGGFIGAILRYAIGGWAQRLAVDSPFPYGTLTVNIAGCLLIGLLAGLVEIRNVFSPDTRLLLLTGVLGAFTTFSTFSYETAALFRDGQIGPGLFNVGAHLLLGLGAVWAGHMLAQLL